MGHPWKGREHEGRGDALSAPLNAPAPLPSAPVPGRIPRTIAVESDGFPTESWADLQRLIAARTIRRWLNGRQWLSALSS